jgi:glycosyltransferase involved in cell wall biosynthesis
MEVPSDLPWELIVVDNNSTDGTRQVVEEFAAASALSVRYVSERNQGLSFARNRGITESRGTIISFVDDDVMTGRNWLQAIHKAFAQFNCAGVSGRTIAAWPCAKPAWFQDEGPYALDTVFASFDLGDTACEMKRPPIGVNMAFRREVFEKYGHFRTDLGRTGKSLMGGEDTEFGRRLMKAGEKFFYIPDAVVHHTVEKERLTKKYFQSWYFGEGRHWMRELGPPRNAVCYFGVPRYLFRSLVETFIRWVFAFDPRRRFYHKLAVCRTAGEIVEARYLSAEAEQRGPI